MKSTSDVTTLPLGRIVFTSRALATLPDEDVTIGLNYHMEAERADRRERDHAPPGRASFNPSFLVTRYSAGDEVMFYIITEPDRSVTRILLPDEC